MVIRASHISVNRLSVLLVPWLVTLLACCVAYLTVRLWKEKEAVKDANRRLREFVAVASHEVPTQPSIITPSDIL